MSSETPREGVSRPDSPRRHSSEGRLREVPSRPPSKSPGEAPAARQGLQRPHASPGQVPTHLCTPPPPRVVQSKESVHIRTRKKQPNKISVFSQMTTATLSMNHQGSHYILRIKFRHRWLAPCLHHLRHFISGQRGAGGLAFPHKPPAGTVEAPQLLQGTRVPVPSTPAPPSSTTGQERSQSGSAQQGTGLPLRGCVTHGDCTDSSCQESLRTCEVLTLRDTQDTPSKRQKGPGRPGGLRRNGFYRRPRSEAAGSRQLEGRAAATHARGREGKKALESDTPRFKPRPPLQPKPASLGSSRPPRPDFPCR